MPLPCTDATLLIVKDNAIPNQSDTPTGSDEDFSKNVGSK
jgi:hypothetical protein